MANVQASSANVWNVNVSAQTLFMFQGVSFNAASRMVNDFSINKSNMKTYIDSMYRIKNPGGST